MRDTRAEELPESIEALLGFVLRHVASELKIDECPAPLAESLRVFTRAVIAATRAEHEHPTPVVEMDGDHLRGVTKMMRPTLPTEPPGVGVSYEDPSQTGRTSRGFPRA